MVEKPEILLVDDRSTKLVDLGVISEDCGAQLHWAVSGNDALALMLKHEFALVILATQLPDMDGFKVAEMMRMNGKNRVVPIIFVTANKHEQQYVFNDYAVGTVDFLFHPVDPQVLRNKVKIFLDLWTQRCKLDHALEENRRISEQLKQQVEFDALTGLPNRALFQDRLRQTILDSERLGNFGALMFIDLDRFKWVNDSMGHDAGDELLVQVAQRLQESVRKSDTISRLGGDEFTVIIKNLTDTADIDVVAKKILKSLDAPFLLNRQEIHISGSIGVTLFPVDSSEPKQLQKNADTAMYEAKAAGRNAYRYFTPEMNAYIKQRMELEAQLRNALEREEFCLHYQPKIDLGSGKITGVEALIRWQQPGEGLVYPDKFIPLAEEVGLIMPISKWVLKTACRQSHQWQSEGFDNLRMSINISPRQLDDKKSLLDDFQMNISEFQIDPDCLELELTENLVMEKLSVAMEILEELNSLGIHLAIDDFGTGYSSLAYLKQFPIKTLKIDKSFIRNLTVGSNDSAIVSAIIAMAQKLSLSVVAEGVETREQLDFLKSNGCTEVQGYYFSKPVTAEEFTELLSDPSLLPEIN